MEELRMPGMLVRFRPTGPWRIGPDSGARDRVDHLLHSDALYSAVCSAMGQLGLLEEWLAATATAEGEPAVRFSSCFPWQEDELFVVPPRHLWPPAPSAKVRWKGARFVPLSLVSLLLSDKTVDEERWVVDPASDCLLPAQRRFASGPFRVAVRSSAAVDRLSPGLTETHATACLEFAERSGMWCAVIFADGDARHRWAGPVKSALRLLSDSGLGGERSRGWGRSASPSITEGTLPSLLLPRLREPKPAPEPVAAPAQEPAAPPLEAPPAEAVPVEAGEPMAAESGLESAASEPPVQPEVMKAAAEAAEPQAVSGPAGLPLGTPSEPAGAEPGEPEPAAVAEPVLEASVKVNPEAPVELAAEPVEPAETVEAAAPVEVAEPAEETPEPREAAEVAEAAGPAEAAGLSEATEQGEEFSGPREVGEAPEMAGAAEPSAPAGAPEATAEPSEVVAGAGPAEAAAPAETTEQAEEIAGPREVVGAAEGAEPAETAAPAEAPEASAEPSEVVAAAEPAEAPPEPRPAPEPIAEPAAAAAPPASAAAPVTAWWLLSLFSPGEGDAVDWARGNYTLLTRSGRVESAARWGDLKKSVRMVGEGSVIISASAPRGGAPDVAPDGFPHPVYRAGFAFAIPIPWRMS